MNQAFTSSKNFFLNNKIRGGILLLLLILFFSAAHQPTAYAKPLLQDTVGEFIPTDCFFETGIPFAQSPEQMGFECGYVVAPETHAEPNGATIRVPVAVRKTTSTSPRPDPLFLAQGGPGGDAFSVFSSMGNTTGAQDRDIVIFNQRGTLYAEPDLVCEENWENKAESLMAEGEDAMRLYQASFEACHKRLTSQEGINLSAFDSIENAADVDIIRQALGYESYNFYGVSYGTLLGLHLIDSQPPALRAVILDSVVTRQTNFLVEIAQTENRAYDVHFNACLESAACQADYPDLEERITQLYAELDETPEIVSVWDDKNEESVDVRVDGAILRQFVFQLFYVADFYAVFPRFVTDIENGDFQFFQALYPLFEFDQTFSEGMYYSVICAEDADFTPSEMNLAGVRPFIAEATREDMGDFLEQCETWRVDPLPNSVDDPVQSDIPILLLSGHFDPVTPPSYAAEAAQTLSNSVNLVSPTASHGVAFDFGCVDTIVADFLNNPEQTPNSACLDDLELTQFVDPSAIHIPIIQDLGSLKTGPTGQFLAFLILAFILLSGFIVWPLRFIIKMFRQKGQEEATAVKPQRRGPIVALLVGILSIAFISAFIYHVVQAFNHGGLLLYGGFNGSARPVFILPLAILLLSIFACSNLIKTWSQSSILRKSYYALLVICMAGVSVLLLTMGLYQPLWG